MLQRLLPAFLPLIFLCMLPSQQSAPQASTVAEIAPEEYQVYAAALDWFRETKKASQPLVADHTSTFSCSAVCNGMHIGGCNGLRDAEETPNERLAIVRRDLSELTVAVTDDFHKKSQQCSEIEAKIPTKARYGFLRQTPNRDIPEDWDSPDLFYFSRVGFNAEQTQALIYVGFMSGTNAKRSEGKYFLFVKQPTGWAPKGSSAIWKLQP